MRTRAERRIIREARRRRIRAAFSIDGTCHPKQARAFRHNPKRRRRVICAGRRAGKTRGVAAAMLWAAAALGWRNIYVTLTRANAAELVWDDLLAINRDWCLGGRVRTQKLRIEFPNGGVVQLAGCNNNREIEKIRGKKWHRVYVDECQSIPDRVLVPLLGPILAPTLLDYGGELWLMGSRPAVRIGRWYEVTEGSRAKNYEQHRFTILDNTLLPARVEGQAITQILKRFREDEGWSEADVTYRREVLNEDIPDLDALLFTFSPERNVSAATPVCEYFVLGIDQGADDSDAIAVLGWRDGDPNLYLVEEFVRARTGGQADVTDLAVEIQARIEKYAPMRMVIDQGGGGKKSANEIRRRWEIPVEAAEKGDKPGFLKLLNRDLRKGIVKCLPGSRFEEDCRLVRKDPEGLMRDVLQELPRKKGGYHSDICDAVLYAWRAARNYLYEPPVKKPAPEQNHDTERERRLQLLANPPERQWWEGESDDMRRKWTGCPLWGAPGRGHETRRRVRPTAFRVLRQASQWSRGGRPTREDHRPQDGRRRAGNQRLAGLRGD